MGNGPSQDGEQSAGDASSSGSKRSKGSLKLKRPARRTKRGDSVHSKTDDPPPKDSTSSRVKRRKDKAAAGSGSGSAVSIGSSISQDVFEDVSQDLSQDVFQDVNQEVSQDVSQEVSQDVGQEVNLDVSQEVSLLDVSQDNISVQTGRSGASSENNVEIGDMLNFLSPVPQEFAPQTRSSIRRPASFDQSTMIKSSPITSAETTKAYSNSLSKLAYDELPGSLPWDSREEALAKERNSTNSASNNKSERRIAVRPSPVKEMPEMESPDRPSVKILREPERNDNHDNHYHDAFDDAVEVQHLSPTNTPQWQDDDVPTLESPADVSFETQHQIPAARFSIKVSRQDEVTNRDDGNNVCYEVQHLSPMHQNDNAPQIRGKELSEEEHTLAAGRPSVKISQLDEPADGDSENDAFEVQHLSPMSIMATPWQDDDGPSRLSPATELPELPEEKDSIAVDRPSVNVSQQDDLEDDNDENDALEVQHFSLMQQIITPRQDDGAPSRQSPAIGLPEEKYPVAAGGQPTVKILQQGELAKENNANDAFGVQHSSSTENQIATLRQNDSPEKQTPVVAGRPSVKISQLAEQDDIDAFEVQHMSPTNQMASPQEKDESPQYTEIVDQDRTPDQNEVVVFTAHENLHVSAEKAVHNQEHAAHENEKVAIVEEEAHMLSDNLSTDPVREALAFVDEIGDASEEARSLDDNSAARSGTMQDATTSLPVRDPALDPMEGALPFMDDESEIDFESSHREEDPSVVEEVNSVSAGQDTKDDSPFRNSAIEVTSNLRAQSTDKDVTDEPLTVEVGKSASRSNVADDATQTHKSTLFEESSPGTVTLGSQFDNDAAREIEHPGQTPSMKREIMATRSNDDSLYNAIGDTPRTREGEAALEDVTINHTETGDSNVENSNPTKLNEASLYYDVSETSHTETDEAAPWQDLVTDAKGTDEFSRIMISNSPTVPNEMDCDTSAAAAAAAAEINDEELVSREVVAQAVDGVETAETFTVPNESNVDTLEAVERSDENKPLTLVMRATDACEESQSLNRIEGEPVAERETAEAQSGPETAEHPSTLETEVVIVADASEERETVEPQSRLETLERPSTQEDEAMLAADGSEESKFPNQQEGEFVGEREFVEQSSVPETAEQPSVLVNEVIIASKESESPNDKDDELLAGRENAEPQYVLENELVIAIDTFEETKFMEHKAVEDIVDGESVQAPPALEDEVVLAAERSECEPLTLNEGNDVVDEESAESPLVSENESILADEPSEEIESLTEKESERSAGEGTSELPSKATLASVATGSEGIVGATGSKHSKSPKELNDISSAAYDDEKETAELKSPTDAIPTMSRKQRRKKKKKHRRNNSLVSSESDAEDTVDHPSAPEAPELPSVLEKDAMIAADASEESKSPNQNQGGPAEEDLGFCEVVAQVVDVAETAETTAVPAEIDGDTTAAAECNDEKPVLRDVVAQAVDDTETVDTSSVPIVVDGDTSEVVAAEISDVQPVLRESVAQAVGVETAGNFTVPTEINGAEAAETNDEIPALQEVVAQAADGSETTDTPAVANEIDGDISEGAAEINDLELVWREVVARAVDEAETAENVNVPTEIDGDTSEVAAAEMPDVEPVLREVVAQTVDDAETAETSAGPTVIDGDISEEAAAEINDVEPVMREVVAQAADVETAETCTVPTEINDAEAAEIHDEDPILRDVAAQAADAEMAETSDDERENLSAGSARLESENGPGEAGPEQDLITDDEDTDELPTAEMDGLNGSQLEIIRVPLDSEIKYEAISQTGESSERRRRSPVHLPLNGDDGAVESPQTTKVDGTSSIEAGNRRQSNAFGFFAGNGWKTSLHRFATAASSTARSAAHSAAPVLVNASAVAAELAEAYRSDKAGKQSDVSHLRENIAKRPPQVATGQSEEDQNSTAGSVSEGLRVIVDNKSMSRAEAIKVDSGVSRELEEESLSNLKEKERRSVDRSDSSLRQFASELVSTAEGAALAAGPVVSESRTLVVDIEVPSDTPKPSQGTYGITHTVGDAAAAEESEINFPSERNPNLDEKSTLSLRVDKERRRDDPNDSFRRFTSAAMSTAGSAAHVAGPFFFEARSFAVEVVARRPKQPVIGLHSPLSNDISSTTLEDSQGVEEDRRVVEGPAAVHENETIVPSEIISKSDKVPLSISELRDDKVRRKGDRSDSSFHRLASAAISTAGSAAHVARPLLSEAGSFAVEVVARRSKQTVIGLHPPLAKGAASDHPKVPRQTGGVGAGSVSLGILATTDMSATDDLNYTASVPIEAQGAAPENRDQADKYSLFSEEENQEEEMVIDFSFAGSADRSVDVNEAEEPILFTTPTMEELMALGENLSEAVPPSTEEKETRTSSDREAQLKEVFRFDGLPNPSQALQIDFAPGNRQSRRGDNVSLSSASSTMSAGSTTKGMLSSGLMSPRVADETYGNSSRIIGSVRGSLGGTRPPLFPRKDREVPDNPRKFVEFLSSKLAAHEAGLSPGSGNETGGTRWMTQPRATSFDADESVFAQERMPRSPSLSPPGSPPEAVLEESEAEDISVSGSQDSVSRSAPFEVKPEVALWDMISPERGISGSIQDTERGRPDYVVMPESSNLAQATPRATAEDSSVSTFSELGISSRTRNRSLFSDASLSSYRRRRRLKPFSSRGSGPRSFSSRSSSRRRLIQQQGFDRSIRTVRSEEPSTNFAPKRGEDYDTVPLGVQSFSPDLDRTKARDYHETLAHSVSSPDLRMLSPAPLSEKDTLPISRRRRVGLLYRSSSSSVLHPGSLPNIPLGNASSGELSRRDAPPDFSIQKPKSLDIFVETSNARLTSIDTLPQNPSPVGLDDNDSLPQPVALDRLGFTDEESDISYEEVMLERALMAFSSIKPIRFPWTNSNEDTDTSLEYVAFVRWQQLDANLKHCEVVKYLTKRHSSPQMNFHQSESDDCSSACTSTGRVKPHLEKIELCGVVLRGDQVETNTNTSYPLPCFLSEIGALALSTTSSMHPADKVLRHKTASASKTIDDLICIAESDLDSFSSLIQQLAAFSGQNERSPEDSFHSINFSVGLKHYQAIEKKGMRKYGGDFLQVKDILRGQIVFPDEGSLVCALVCLHRLHSGQNLVYDVDDEIHVDLVRFKNSFVTETPEKGSSSEILPTGYGHILLNVRLKSGLLAEIQCHLASVFEVLGEEGYLLHREISELDEVLAGKRNEGQESCSNSSYTIHDIIAQVVPRGLATSSEGDPMGLIDIFGEAAAGKPDSPSRTLEALTAYSVDPSPSGSKERTSDTREPIEGSDEVPTPLTRNTTTSVDLAEGQDGIFVFEFEDNETKNAGVIAVQIVKEVDSGETETPSDRPQSIAKDEPQKTLNRSTTDDAAGSTQPPSEMDEHQRTIRTELPGACSSPPHRKSIAAPTSFDYTYPHIPFSEVETPKAAGGRVREFSRMDSRDTSECQGTRAEKFLGSIDRKDALEAFRTSCRNFSDMDFYKALLMRGAQVISENPRDVPSFYCLHVISAFLSNAKHIDIPHTPEKMVDFSRQCLFRSLTVSNQVASAGMMGWLEYGSSTHVRDIERPFEIQHAVACNYAKRQMWRDAEDTLKALVMSLEQQFPPYHPTTLAALLDLAAVSAVISNDTFAARNVKKASQRLSLYLSEVEDRFISRRDECIRDRHSNDAVFRIDRDRDWLSMLTTFVSTFESHLDRELVRIIGSDNHIALVHHCLVADSLVVLANCVATATQSSISGATRRAYYWGQALIHYRYALKGFTRKLGLDDPNVAAVAYGAARCLRELGRTEEALQVLSKIVDISKQAVAAESIATKSTPRNVASDRDPRRSSFLPQRCFRRREPVHAKTKGCKRMSSALCFWLMAALTADTNPDERGRDRALGLLRSASKSLQAGLVAIPERDSSTKAAYIEFLQKIEDEAKSLLGIPRDSERGREEQGSAPHHANRSTSSYPMSSQQPSMWST